MKAFALLFLSLSVLFSQPSHAEDRALALPPIMYLSTLDDTLFAALKQQPALAQLDKELYGSPLRLAVTHTFAPTAGGTAAGVTSAMLAGSTLGILPVVDNSDLIVTYTVSAHGRTLSSFSYSKNFTRATNLFSGSNNIHKLDKGAMTWALSTVDQFIVELGKSAEINAISKEYAEYFGSEHP